MGANKFDHAVLLSSEVPGLDEKASYDDRSKIKLSEDCEEAPAVGFSKSSSRTITSSTSLDELGFGFVKNEDSFAWPACSFFFCFFVG